MSYTLNNKIKELVPYEPISGTYKIRLDANECPENLPDDIRRQIDSVMQKIDYNRYPDPLAEKLVNSFAEFYDIKPGLVTAGNGSDELIFLVESAFLEKGDKMLVVSPDFSMYGFYSSICEVECASFVKDDNLDIDVDALIEKLRRENIKLLLFSNPCNPTGRGVTADDVRRLVNSTNALVILDEAYMDFWDQSLLSEVESYDNLIIFRTASKAVGCAALRLGFAVANPVISRAIKAVKSPYNVNSISQAVGEVVYKNKEYLHKRKITIVNNREKLYNELTAIEKTQSDFKVYQSVANFVFVKTGRAAEIWEFLKQKSIVVRLMGGYLRITAGTEYEVSQTVSALKEYLGVIE
jgi:histidinol-phosphate aminotransferase